MATQTEVDILLKTTADLTGVQQLQQASQQATQAGQRIQQVTTGQQQAVNAMLRQAMQGQPQTLGTFSRELERVAQATTIRPTLLPRDFGIQAAQAAAAARTTATAVEDVRRSAGVTGNEVLRMGVAFVGAGVGLSAFSAAGQYAHAFLQQLVQDAIAAEQVQRANTVTLGQSAQGYQQWAQTVSQQAGIAQTALLQAGTGAQQFGRSIGFGPQDVQGLTAVALTLSRLQGADFGQTMSQLTAALRGNEQAAQSLNLQLDAGYVAYTQLDGATQDVFNSLDPLIQQSLRYQSVLGQLPNQINNVQQPTTDLQKAQEALNKQWDDFVNTYGPGVVTWLGGTLGLMNNIIQLAKSNPDLLKQFLGDLSAVPANPLALISPARQIQQDWQQYGPDVMNAINLWWQRVAEGAGTYAERVQRANEVVRQQTGVDVLKTLGDTAQATAAKAGQMGNDLVSGLNLGNTAATQTAQSLIVVADNADRAASAGAQYQQHLADVARTAQLVAQTQVEQAAAEQMAVRAAEELNRLKQESLNITATEAQVRLGMLPAQQRMLELQNQVNQVQLQAQMQTLPASRQLQDMQNAIRQQQLIAEDPTRSAAERTAAQRRGAAIELQIPRAELADLNARIGALPSSRAAEDVNNAARLQQLREQAVLQPYDFAKQQNDLMAQVASAAKAVAERAFQLSVQAINIIVQGGPQSFSDEDWARVAQLSGQAVVDGMKQAVKRLGPRNASPSLAGAVSP